LPPQIKITLLVVVLLAMPAQLDAGAALGGANPPGRRE
jgi:hypothetical protein